MSDKVKWSKKRKKHFIIRLVSGIVSVGCIAAIIVLLMTPSTARVAYTLHEIKAETAVTAAVTGSELPEIYQVAEEERKSNELENLFELAESKLGCKYVHSTAGPTTFDCQGYVHYLFTHCDARVKCYVPRGGCTNQYNAIKQYQISTDPSDAKRGDIVYFYGGGRWKHVGVAMGDGKLIHATTIGPGRSCVKITDMPDWYSKYAVVRVLE